MTTSTEESVTKGSSTSQGNPSESEQRKSRGFKAFLQKSVKWRVQRSIRWIWNRKAKLIPSFLLIVAILVGWDNFRDYVFPSGRAKSWLKARGIEYTERAFLEAVLRGDNSAIEQFLTAGIRPDARDELRNTPLIISANEGLVETCNLLIRNNSPVNEKNNEGRTALIAAIERGSLEIVRLLIKARADVNSKNEYGYSPLVAAVKRKNLAIVNELLDANANIDQPTSTGGTPLMIAAAAPSEDIALELLKRGANANAQDQIGESPLMIAARAPSEPIVMALLESNADINHRNLVGETPLFRGVQSTNTDIVRQLIERKADVHSKTKNGRTAVFEAVGPEVAGLLVKAGADVNLRDADGWTTLMVCTLSGNDQMVKYLLSVDADFRIRSAYGTALKLANENKHQKIVDLLTKAGATE